MSKDRHSVKPSEELDVLLVVVWLKRRPLVDQRDCKVFGQVAGVTWNQACPDKHEDAVHCLEVIKSHKFPPDTEKFLHHSQLLLKLQDYGLQFFLLLEAATLQLLQSSLQPLVLCFSVLQLGLAQAHKLLQVTLTTHIHTE